MAGASILNRLDPARLARLADWLAVAVAASLPWSTSATGVLIVLWALALIPTLNWAHIRRELVTPAGGLPVLLCLLGALGMLWADVTWVERWDGVGSFFKLLVIPLLLVHFRRSDRGMWPVASYGLSCAALLLVSFVLTIWPHLFGPYVHEFGVPVKNAATQSGEFVTCIFGLTYLAYDCIMRRRWWWLLGLLTVIFAMLADIFFIATGRTALVIIPVLLALFAIKKLSSRGIMFLFAGAIAIGALGWISSPYLRARAVQVWTEYQDYEATDARNSSGERIEFAKKSIGFIREAPIIGHGTGSIHSLFIKSAIGQSGAAGSDTTNPHNQTFAVAIQLGLIGAVVLWAMWIAHLLLFRGHGLAEWIGLGVVVQNIVGSLFNSHLFDFTQAWIYVFGVGVAGGMALKNRAMQKSLGAAT